MTTGNEIHGNFIFALQTQSVDGNIRVAVFRIGAVAQAHGNVRAGVFFSIGRCRDKLANIEAFVSCQMHYFLAGGLICADNYGWDRGSNGIF